MTTRCPICADSRQNSASRRNDAKCQERKLLEALAKDRRPGPALIFYLTRSGAYPTRHMYPETFVTNAIFWTGVLSAPGRGDRKLTSEKTPSWAFANCSP